MECKGIRSSFSLAFAEGLADAPETMVAAPSGRSLSPLNSRLYWLRLTPLSPGPDLPPREVNGERRIELRFFRCTLIFSRGAKVGRQPARTATAGSTTVQLLNDVLSIFRVRTELSGIEVL